MLRWKARSSRYIQLKGGGGGGAVPSGALSSATGLRARQTEIPRSRTAVPGTGGDPEIVDTMVKRLHLKQSAPSDRRGSTANTARISPSGKQSWHPPKITGKQRASKHGHIEISRPNRSARRCSGARRWRCPQRRRASPGRIERNRENQARGWRDHRGRGHEAVA